MLQKNLLKQEQNYLSTAYNALFHYNMKHKDQLLKVSYNLKISKQSQLLNAYVETKYKAFYSSFCLNLIFNKGFLLLYY